MNVGLNNVMIFLEIVLRESKRISSVGTDFDRRAVASNRIKIRLSLMQVVLIL